MTKAKILILLSLSLVIQSLSSVFIKFAGQYETLSREFIIFYVLAIGCLGIYAIMWQFLLELIPLTTAYLRKGILYILILFFFSIFVSVNYIFPCIQFPGVCLKNAFCKIYVTICGRFCLNEGGVAGYVNRMKTKYTAKWGM